MDNDFDDGPANDGDDAIAHQADGPAKAREAACHTEEQRATLARALRTIIGAVYARGFDIEKVAGHDMPKGCSSTDPALEVPLSEFAVPARCVAAAKEHEILLFGVVPEAGPRPGTPAAAHDLAPGTQTAVVCMNTGDVKPVRDAVKSIRTNWPRVQTVIFVSFCRLTPFTRKEIMAMTVPRVQHFNVVDDLQHQVLSHRLVPVHRVLNRAEAARAKIRFKSCPTEDDSPFPMLSTQDAPVRLLGLQAGDLVCVTETWGRTAAHDTIFIVKDI